MFKRSVAVGQGGMLGHRTAWLGCKLALVDGTKGSTHVAVKFDQRFRDLRHRQAFAKEHGLSRLTRYGHYNQCVLAPLGILVEIMNGTDVVI